MNLHGATWACACAQRYFAGQLSKLQDGRADIKRQLVNDSAESGDGGSHDRRCARLLIKRGLNDNVNNNHDIEKSTNLV